MLRMTTPRVLRGRSIDELEPGVPVGRSWILLGGVLPVDYDDLGLVEIERRAASSSDRGCSSMSLWQHERVIEPTGEPAPARSPTASSFALRRPLAASPGRDGSRARASSRASSATVIDGSSTLHGTAERR